MNIPNGNKIRKVSLFREICILLFLFPTPDLHIILLEKLILLPTKLLRLIHSVNKERQGPLWCEFQIEKSTIFLLLYLTGTAIE